MATSAKRRCRAFAANSRAQCQNNHVFGSRYCWHHQSWGANLISVLLAGVSGFLINVLSTKYTEKMPKLVPYLNWELLANDTVFVYPTNATYPSNAPWHDLTFWIRNDGETDASEMFVRLATHSYASNFVHAPKWNVEEVGAFAHTDEILVALVQRGDRPLPPTFGAKFQPLAINSGKVRSFGGFLTYGAVGAETKRSRVHVVFDNPPGVTNVFRDEEARGYLSKFDPGIAQHQETAIGRFILESTDEGHIILQGNPGARVEVVTDETNLGTIILKTNILRR